MASSTSPSPRQRKRRERRARNLRPKDGATARQRKRRGQLRVQALRRTLHGMTCPSLVHLYDRAGRVCDTIDIVTDDPKGILQRARVWLRHIECLYRERRLRNGRELEYVIWIVSDPQRVDAAETVGE